MSAKMRHSRPPNGRPFPKLGPDPLGGANKSIEAPTSSRPKRKRTQLAGAQWALRAGRALWARLVACKHTWLGLAWGAHSLAALLANEID